MRKILTIALMAIFAISAHAQNHWTYNPHLYANTMTMVGVVHINDAEIPRESMEVGAFCGDECRGSETLHHHPNADRYLVYLSISGGNGDVIQFRLYDAETEVELMAAAPTVTFEANAMLGRAGDPYVLDFSTAVDEVPIVAETNEVGATGAGGSVEGSGSYLYGEDCTLTAVPDAGCYFENWTEETEGRATVVVCTEPVYTFVVTGRRNLTANFTTVPPEGGASNQYVQLYPGWNWWSSSLEMDATLDAALKGAIAAENTTAVIKNVGGNTMLENGTWSPPLALDNESMYMIRVDNAVTATLAGTPAKPGNHPISLASGWNWIGFPSVNAMTLDEAFASITPNEEDVVKGTAGPATYTAQYGWNGSLTGLEPGAGYMYKNNGAEMTLTYPGGAPTPIHGAVEIPEGMDASQIVVTNYVEEALLDEEGNFEIVSSNMLVAKNTENNSIVYLGLYSIEQDNNNGRVLRNDYELDAKETALFFALKLLPFYMRDGSDAVLNKMKESVYTLSCVQNLETVIQNTVNTYGYLKKEEIADALKDVGEFFYSEFSSIEPEELPSGKARETPRDLLPPYFSPNNHKHGVRLVINDSQFSSQPDKWTINCTGYSSQFTALALVPGYLDEGSNTFSWNHYTVEPYYLPPMSTSQYIELAEDIGFLAAPGNWMGMIQLYRSIKTAIKNPEYLLPYISNHVDNITFEIPRAVNAIGVLTPKENAGLYDQLEMVNMLYMIFDIFSVFSFVPGTDAISISLTQIQGLIDAFLQDGEFNQLFMREYQNGREGLEVIVDAIAEKIDEKAATVISNIPTVVLNELISDFLFINEISSVMDLLIMGITMNVLNSFELPLVADFPISELPTVVITSAAPAGMYTANIDARIIDEGSHSIEETGFCYSTSPNPGLNDIVIPGDYVSANEFACTLENLERNTTYYIRAYAKNWLELVGYSEEMSFTTLDGPEVTTLDVTGITSSTALANAQVSYPNPDLPVEFEKGFLYGTENEGLWYGSVGCDYAVFEGTTLDEFSCTLSGLEANTTYYVKAYAKGENDVVGYGDVVSFTTLPEGGGTVSEGALTGAFTVNANGDQVNFSQGNLQYQASANTWRFAENQWDCIGDANNNISSTYSGYIDLFGWGTSGYSHGANCYQPWSISETNGDYYAYGIDSYNLNDQTGQADWGYNAINNGGNTENSGWHTLTYEEWVYLVDTRSTSSGIRYAKATVNNVNGVILLPDDWSTDYYTLNRTNTSDASFSSNTITASQWSILEQHGAVFLPAAGCRYGTSVEAVGSDGFYWSASYDYGGNAWGVYFGESYLGIIGYRRSNRYFGQSVRLVRSASGSSYVINVSSNPTDGGTVSGAGAYQAGEECTLTASPASGYEFSHWTEQGVTVSTLATYSFTVTGGRSLVANFIPLGGGNTGEGALTGAFTVNANGDQVNFSQGNLQYQASTNTWRFAENQWDYIGSDNSNISSSYSGYIDLFGWGTSGYNHGANCYQPWSISKTNGDYYAYGIDSYNLNDQTGQADWGYNAISNGGNTENSGWRTLTYEEWVYLFNTRSTSSGIRYAKATVNNVNGVILLPDDWSTDYYTLNSTNTGNAYFSSNNTITASQWSTLEQHGAVFLPAAGRRIWTSVYGVGSYGYYWSASFSDTDDAWSVYFNDSHLSTGSISNRFDGYSVRLVRSSQ